MTLEKDILRFEPESNTFNPYEEHYLRGNPFPGYGETEFDVCTNQDKIRMEFISILRSFSPEAKRLRIDGKNGAGKTNILRYFELLTNAVRRRGSIANVHPIYIRDPGDSYFDIHRQIVDRLSDLFLEDLLNKLQQNPQEIGMLSKKITSASEILAAIDAFVGPSDTLFPIYGERNEDTLIRWLKGQKLTGIDKKLITHNKTPPADITSPSLAIRFLHGLLEVLKKLNLCDGIVLLFDEFEEIFEGLSRSRQSRYAQDLRHFFDTLKESTFFVIATVPDPRDLAQYPAIERRLGDPLELQSMNSLELATKFVADYLNSGRDKYEAYRKANQKQGGPPRPACLEPLTHEIVKQEYCSLEETAKKAELDVLPGYFLPKMRERIKRIVEDDR